MRTRLAWHNLAHHKIRSLAAVAGVTFAVVLVFLQLGFRSTAEQTASIVYDALDFDILLRSKQTQRLAQCRPFPRLRVYQAASMPGVRDASSLVLTYGRWQSLGGKIRPIMLIGVEPSETVFAPEELREKVSLLTAPEFLLIDRASRQEFGPQDQVQFGDRDVGTEAELAFRRVRIVGHFLLGNSFDADGLAVVSQAGFLRLRPGWPADHVSLGLIRLQKDASPDAVAQNLRQFFQAHRATDVDVFTRHEIVQRERHVWLWEMSIGVIFTAGVCVACVVGSVIVYQVLSSDVANHLPEYATLKAMGYSDGFLARTVLEQAAILALLGFVPGLLIAEVLYAVTKWKTRLPMAMTWLRIAWVAAMALGMCIASGLIALRKLRQADPADLY